MYFFLIFEQKKFNLFYNSSFPPLLTTQKYYIFVLYNLDIQFLIKLQFIFKIIIP